MYKRIIRIIVVLMLAFLFMSNVSNAQYLNLDEAEVSLPLYGNIVYNTGKDTIKGVFILDSKMMTDFVIAEKENIIYKDLIMKYGDLSNKDIMIIDTLRKEISILRLSNGKYVEAIRVRDLEIVKYVALAENYKKESNTNNSKYEKAETERSRLEKKVGRLQKINNFLIATTSVSVLTIVILAIL